MLIVSLNEIEAMALKAARGAGFAWGEAEEIARAARWLGREGVDVARALRVLLVSSAVLDAEACPIRLGLAWVDTDDPALAAEPVRQWPHVRHPLWLAAVIATNLHPMRRAIRIDWRIGRAAVERRGDNRVQLCLSGDALADMGAPVVLQPFDESERAASPSHVAAGERTVDAAAWAELDRLGARTYVPASEASRLLGAGAGTSDND